MYAGYANTGRPGTGNMNYAMSPNSKRMMASKPNMSAATMNNSNVATIPTPGRANQSAAQSQSNMNSSAGQYAQQANQPNKYRVARKQPMPQSQYGQQMMYQQ